MLRSIILPAYNEEGYIAEMVAATIAAGEKRPDPFEIIVIDNASSDATASIVQKIARNDSRVRLVVHPENRLYAGSCATGVKAARGERIFILDSDGQHPPEDIWKFDAVLDQGHDIVFGWRREREESPLRIVMSKVLWFLSRYYIGFPLHDINCGIRGFNRVFADRLEIHHRVNFVNPELYLRARSGGFKMSEVMIRQQKRKAGKTSHALKHPWKIFCDTTGYLSRLREELHRKNGHSKK